MIVYSGIEGWNGPISGNNAEYSSPSLAPLLASASKLLIQARTAQGSGTNPTLTVDIEKSNDGLSYTSVGANAPINAVAVSTTGVTNAFAQWDTTASDNLFGCFLRLKISLGGTTPSANIRVTVTGRSKRPRRGSGPALRAQQSMPGSKPGCSCPTGSGTAPLSRARLADMHQVPMGPPPALPAPGVPMNRVPAGPPPAIPLEGRTVDVGAPWWSIGDRQCSFIVGRNSEQVGFCPSCWRDGKLCYEVRTGGLPGSEDPADWTVYCADPNDPEPGRRPLQRGYDVCIGVHGGWAEGYCHPVFHPVAEVRPLSPTLICDRRVLGLIAGDPVPRFPRAQWNAPVT